MDAVKSFNAELSGLYEVKPPISKAKMTSITRGAIKAIKFYKHVVQSVEKFILKCKPEYKVPGLYVIDSIVRQSRHQFGADRDVFAPRFAKNMQQTFINLFKCPAEDKSKVIRVLNLWQKNQVFHPEVIQPLFDLADPNHPIHREQGMNQSNGMAMQNSMTGIMKGSPALQKSPAKGNQGVHQAESALSHLSGVANNPNALHDPTTLAQLQQLQKLLQWQADGKSEGQPVRFDRKLLDFDYGDDEDEDRVNPSPKQLQSVDAYQSVGTLLSNPEVLRQLQTIQQTMSQSQHQEFDLEKLRKLQEMKQQEDEFDKHLAQTVPNLPFASECDLKPPIVNNSPAVMGNYYMSGMHDVTIPPPGYKLYDPSAPQEDATLDSEVQYVEGNDSAGDVEVINLDHSDSRSLSPREERYSRRRRSRSRDRSRDRRDRDRRSRRSRSRSRSRSRDRRRRSRSRERDREKDKEKEKGREKEKERKKRGLPSIKKEHMSVCSTTLWVGHLSKLVHQEELSDTFGEFGDVVSIDLIPPRGCAFIVMNRRQDAFRCLQKLRSHKLQGKAITIAWAPGKGVKGKDFKDYWEVEAGASYIPWSKIKQNIDLELLEDGGMVDEDTMPAWLKAKVAQQTPKPLITPTLLTSDLEGTPTFVQVSNAVTAIDTSQPPPMATGTLLQAQLPLPIVSPFQLNNRLMPPMNLPPGMMANVPIGVPPPSLPPGAVLSNQLMGIGSPFTQAPPSLVSQLQQLQNQDKAIGEANAMGIPFGVIPPAPPISVQQTLTEENMDVEMEDADKEKPALSDQLLASLERGNENNFGPPINRLNSVSGKLDMDNRRDRLDDRNDRGRDRDRDNRDRFRDRNRRSRDRDRDRDGRDRRDDRRDKNRWNDRDRRDRDKDDREERRERERNLNDRLREMAGETNYQSRGNLESRFEPPLMDVPPPPPLLSRPRYDPYNDDIPPPEPFEGKDRFMPSADLNEDREPDEWNEEVPDYQDDMEEPRDFEEERPFEDPRRPPLPLLGRNDRFMDEPRYMRPGRRDDFEQPPLRRGPPHAMDYEGLPIRGPGPKPFGPGIPGMGPKMRPDYWSPRMPMMRGPGLLGPRMMGRPPMFHPRGPLIRGPRPPGGWMEGGIRPNFAPRFDGPRFSKRPMGPPGPPGIFDEPPLHMHHRRRDDRWHHRPDFEANDDFNQGRRNRWSGPFNEEPEGPPGEQDDGYNDDQQEQPAESDYVEGGNEDADGEVGGNEVGDDGEQGEGGGATPLHDEPEEQKNESAPVAENGSVEACTDEAS